MMSGGGRKKGEVHSEDRRGCGFRGSPLFGRKSSVDPNSLFLTEFIIVRWIMGSGGGGSSSIIGPISRGLGKSS